MLVQSVPVLIVKVFLITVVLVVLVLKDYVLNIAAASPETSFQFRPKMCANDLGLTGFQ